MALYRASRELFDQFLHVPYLELGLGSRTFSLVYYNGGNVLLVVFGYQRGYREIGEST